MEIYLDHSATTPCCPEAVEACRRAMTEGYGNPSSLHRKGFEAERLMLEAKEQLGAALSCLPEEILFTSGATEANNLALIGAARARERSGKTIVISAVEHPSVLETAGWLEGQGFRIRKIGPDAEGRFTPEAFAGAVDGDTVLVSAMLVNNETGAILPVWEIARAVKRVRPEVLVHTDAVQGFLKLPIRLKNTAVDLLSVSGHKVCAPKGIGALFVRRGVRLLPLLHGGGQQGGLRSGTEPVPLIAALGAAAAAQSGRIAGEAARYARLRERLLVRMAEIPDVTVRQEPVQADWIASLSVRGVRSEILLHFLEEAGIYVSSGSACSRGGPSHVLAALGMDRRTADETIRVSFGAGTEDGMIDALADRIGEAVRVLQKRR